jgi:Predicted Zn-dependent proteases and their inactivated homologs
MLSPENAKEIAERLVARGVAAGATAADALYAGSRSSSVQVRLGELEDVSRSEDEEIGLRLFVGQRSATVASSDLSDEALGVLVERCLAMAGEAPEDPYAGLAPSELLQRGELPLLDSIDPADPDPAHLRARALESERAALGVKGAANSSGVSASASASTIALATSGGFSGAYRSTGHALTAVIVAGEGAAMQRDYAGQSARHLEDLDTPVEVGRLAGERAVKRLTPTRPKPGKYPVLFDPRVSLTLLGHFVGAISGASVARGTSFLKDKLGEQIFASGVTIVDDPLRRPGSGRARSTARACTLGGASWSAAALSINGSPKARRRGSSTSSPPAMPLAVLAALPAQSQQPLSRTRSA